LAAEIAKNNAGEQEAIEGYYKLLAIEGISTELIRDLMEIIGDEMNHSAMLSGWVTRLTGVKANKT
jgi:rubrerythrin